ncbi:CoA transferase [Variovorax sp. RHLX14]|uniref:CoA transferase n=1 Tax=Variovorax sp. RHLX14 TaxID=1259731 RepID=UPI003F4848A4
MNPIDVLRELWLQSGLSADALNSVDLTGADPVFPSSFAVGTAAQTTVAAAALAAWELGRLRGLTMPRLSVDMTHAAVEATGWFSIDGVAPDLWDAFSGLYRCADGYVRIHANFSHHREGALQLLGLDPATSKKNDVERALSNWSALDFEEAAAEKGLVVTALRSFDEWDATLQGQALRTQPLFTIERIGEAEPLTLPPIAGTDDGVARPLAGVRVLDLTRILAGPVGGRTLAEHGAEVLLVNSPLLPNIAAIADTSRGKLSTHVDLKTAEGRAALQRLIADAHVFVQGYRPGGLYDLGFGSHAVAKLRPGIVYVSLSAYGTQGPWADRRGFDSLVQTAMGFNQAEGEAAGDGKPRPLPMQILDEATGFLIAFCTAVALCRQQQEGGSWEVKLSLAQTGQWLRSLGRVPGGLATLVPDRAPYVETTASGFGELAALRHAAHAAGAARSMQPTQVKQVARPSMPPGSHPPSWPDA